MKRPSWDEYFIQMVELVSTRSPDPHTKHGCIAVDKNHRIKSTGYNGPIRGVDDSKIPATRPKKYPFYIHSEDNMLLNANGNVEGCTVYLTGYPCHICLRRLIQAGIKKIIYGNRNSHCIDGKDLEASKLMIELSGIEIKSYSETLL